MSATNKSGRMAVFQMHHTDVVEGLKLRNGVEIVRDSDLFEHVVIAAADVPENRVLEEWAERWKVRLMLGDEFDVARRIQGIATELGCHTIARALVWWFFLDLELLGKLLDAQEATDADRIALPLDFDMRFGADVFRGSFLDKVSAAFRDDEALAARHRMNPWGLAEAEPERFVTKVFEDVPCWDRTRFESVRVGMQALWPERWDGSGTPLHPYRIASDCVQGVEHPQILDLACGLGAGSKLLSEHGRVLGVDVDGGAIATCRERYGDSATFRHARAEDLDIEPGSLDLVVSVHTMEHVPDDGGFLKSIATWLGPSGHLVLEVPLLAKRPFADVGEPLSPDHEREYAVEELKRLVGERFEIIDSLGVNRGAYLSIERARSAACLVARPLRRNAA